MIWGAMENEWNGGRSYADSSVAKVSRWLKHDSTPKMSVEEQMSHMSRLVSEANEAFYLLECAQVRSPEFAARLVPVGETYPSYAALAEAVRQQAERLERNKESKDLYLCLGNRGLPHSAPQAVTQQEELVCHSPQRGRALTWDLADAFLKL